MGKRTEAERFWAKVDKNGPIPDYAPRLGPCWLWTAAKNEHGYGLLRVQNQRRNVRAHRWSYEALVGPIPDGLQLDHLCRVPACCNPRHLEPVTFKVNMERSLPGRRVWRRERTHCINGHEFTDETTYIYRGQRQCRVCIRESERRTRQRKRAAQ